MNSSKSKTTGDQVVNKVDLKAIASSFINFYYKNWMENCDNLFRHPMWKPYTKMCVDGVNIDVSKIIPYHKEFYGARFELINFQFVPDGSRRLDIMSKGKITFKGIDKIIIQSFNIIENKEQWFLKSTQIYFV